MQKCDFGSTIVTIADKRGHSYGRGFSFVVKANRNFDENFDLEMRFLCYLQSSETLLKQKQLYEIIKNVKKTLKYNNYIVNNVIELIHVIDCYSIKSAIQIIQ